MSISEQEIDYLLAKLSLLDKVEGIKESKLKAIEQELANRFCRCIKHVSSQGYSEPSSIAICTKSVFSTKGLKRHNFRCKNGPKLLPSSYSKESITKK